MVEECKQTNIDASYACWERETQVAHHLFNASNFGAAFVHYDLANLMACRLFADLPNRTLATRLVLVSCQNLVRLWITCGKPEKAEQELRTSYSYLLRARPDRQARILDMALARGIRLNYQWLKHHVRWFGSSAGDIQPPTYSIEHNTKV